MTEERPAVRAIAWREVFPWLRLLQVFRMAIRPRVLLLAIVAALLCKVGWQAIGTMFDGSSDANIAYEGADGKREFGPVARLYTRWPWEPLYDVPGPDGGQPMRRAVQLQGTNAEISASGPAIFASFLTTRPIKQLVGFGEIFSPTASTSLTAFLSLCLVWAIAVWAFAGGVITRIAAVGFARGEQISWNRATQFGWRKWPSFFASPMLPILGVVLIALFMALFGLIMRIPYIGIPMIAIAWPLFLIGGLLMAILLLGLVVGWPLMWCTVSCEGTDSFDALGRSYGYVFGKPLQYLGYGVVALVFGWLGWQVVSIFSELLVNTTQWAVSWGSGGKNMHLVSSLLPFAAKTPDGVTGLDVWSAKLIYFFNGCVRSIPVAFLYSFFWCGATMIYLLLRRDEDQTEIDEVFLEDEQETYGMPPLRTDAAGVSQPADVPAPTPTPKPPAAEKPAATEKPASDGKPPAAENDSGPLPLE
ncbi:MAG: hypothetical protein WD875_02070 [Pirellulales bacterium]